MLLRRREQCEAVWPRVTFLSTEQIPFEILMCAMARPFCRLLTDKQSRVRRRVSARRCRRGYASVAHMRGDFNLDALARNALAPRARHTKNRKAAKPISCHFRGDFYTVI